MCLNIAKHRKNGGLGVWVRVHLEVEPQKTALLQSPEKTMVTPGLGLDEEVQMDNLDPAISFFLHFAATSDRLRPGFSAGLSGFGRGAAPAESQPGPKDAAGDGRRVLKTHGIPWEIWEIPEAKRSF